MSKFLLLAAILTIASTAFADSIQEQQKLDQYAARLDAINFLPTLLPLIIANSDIIGLSDAQVKTLLNWRKRNRADVITTLSKIVQKRVDIRKAALSPNVSSSRIEQMQAEIFQLQHRVLMYKLSCRDLVFRTFNKTNWDGFMFVLAEHDIGIELPDVTAMNK